MQGTTGKIGGTQYVACSVCGVLTFAYSRGEMTFATCSLFMLSCDELGNGRVPGAPLRATRSMQGPRRWPYRGRSDGCRGGTDPSGAQSGGTGHGSARGPCSCLPTREGGVTFRFFGVPGGAKTSQLLWRQREGKNKPVSPPPPVYEEASRNGKKNESGSKRRSHMYGKKHALIF